MNDHMNWGINGMNQNVFWGMHLIWWFVWIGLLIWIFALPYDIPYQRRSKEAPLDLLKKRFASGQINAAEYAEKKAFLENEGI